MPVYDYECYECEHRFEVIESPSQQAARSCPECGKASRRIISAGRCFTGNNEAAWVKTVQDVVAKGEDADAHDRRFLSSGMTKNDLKRWMKAKGLRHLEPGEPTKPPKPDTSWVPERIMQMRRERRRIEVNSR